MRAGSRSRSRMIEKEREKQEHLARAAGNAAIMQRSPVEKPPFTLGQIKKAIPPHCFERSVLKSFSYVLQDLVIAAALLYLELVTIPAVPSPLHYAAWPLYWIAQGCVCTGLWVIGHECAHNAFSDYPLLDDIVGLYSHRRHHSNIGSLERDEVFVPKKKEALPWYTPYVCSNPAGRLLQIVVQLTLGWPLYLATNASGRLYPRFACHYDPYGPIYSDRERAQVFVSDAGVVAVSSGLYKLAATFGFWWVVRVYAVTLLIVNAWLVLVTFFQHTHPALPRYDSSEWDWLRGALATMDRDYGVLNRVFHNITDTHVVHHLFSTVPHYHAMEASKAIKPILGEYYQFDPTPIAKATWREATRECIYVEPEDDRGIFWYKKF
ncbi:unnamed protein product [Miscanthus lutarioriparius]|uniref:Uncharacterized protein n=1 Tax=Miscanthus lutarioriparius TaxID=422564 RepID=A0A811PTP8_9POAL|nr:unnamed protein product [Miscanthus lutarioriparius]